MARAGPKRVRETITSTKGMVSLKGPSPLPISALLGRGEVGFLEVREDFRDGGFGQLDADRAVERDLHGGVPRPGHALELDVGDDHRTDAGGIGGRPFRRAYGFVFDIDDLSDSQLLDFGRYLGLRELLRRILDGLSFVHVPIYSSVW